jgi:hypothetical protein
MEILTGLEDTFRTKGHSRHWKTRRTTGIEKTELTGQKTSQTLEILKNEGLKEHQSQDGGGLSGHGRYSQDRGPFRTWE